MGSFLFVAFFLDSTSPAFHDLVCNLARLLSCGYWSEFSQ